MKLTLTDQLGDVTKIDFIGIHDNVELPDSIFAFKAPPGADIVTAPLPPRSDTLDRPVRLIASRVCDG